MKIDTYDGFLNEATHAAAAAWEKVGGKRLDTDELYDLNDVLDAFFSAVLEGPPERERGGGK